MKSKGSAHNLLDNLARGVQINETLVYFEFVTIPGLGTLTARLAKEEGTLKDTWTQGL